MAFKVSEKEHNESLRAAVRAAAYLKETDEIQGHQPYRSVFQRFAVERR